MKIEEVGLWHHYVVQDLNLPGWWQSVKAPGCGVSHWSCQARPRHINRISPLAGRLALRAPQPFEVTGPLSPLGEAWDLIPLLTHTHTHACQDTNTHIFTYSNSRRHICTHKHIICSRSIKHPKNMIRPCVQRIRTSRDTQTRLASL